MTNAIHGINTASIKNNDRLFAMAFKIKYNDDKQQMLYMQLDELLNLLIALKSRQQRVAHHLTTEGDTYKEKIIATNNKLANNVPVIEADEVQQPNLEYRVVSLAAKVRDDHLSLIVMFQNEQVITLLIEDLQIEFILFAIQQAINTANDQETAQQICSMLDFLPLYYADFSDEGKMNYHESPQDGWKQNLFSHHIAVLYCFETEKGKKIRAGAVIKTSSPHQSEEEKNIILRMATLSSHMKNIQKEHPLCQYFCRILPSQPNKMLSIEECLDPLHAFYLDMQANLQS